MSKTRVIAALRDEIWALTPAKLGELMEFVDALAMGANVPVDAAAPGGPDAGSYAVIEDGVAVIGIEGVMTRRANMVNRASGGTSSQMIAQAIVRAAADQDVRGIILDVDSPGGSVTAPQEIGQAIAEARASVPVVAWSGGAMCSAAYWVASQCDAIVAQDTAQVGSIGVVVEHRDRSGADAKDGVARTFITAGKYKRMAHDAAPLDEEGAAYLQGKVDTYYTKFVDAVAVGRGVDAATVQERMADGRIFIGAEALDAGLVDAIGPFNVALEIARDKRRQNMTVDKGAKASTQLSGVTLEALTQERPDLLAEARSGMIAQADADKLTTDAVAAERARIVEILEAQGDQAVTMAAIQDGTPAAQVYKGLFEASKQKTVLALSDMHAILGDHAGAAGASVKDRDPKAETFESKVAAYMAEGKTKGQATEAAATNFPELHSQWLSARKGA